MSHSLHQTEGGPAAQTVTLNQPSPVDSLSLELLEHLHRLRLILPVISVSVMALHCQDAESDSDIARVLSQHADEPLDCEIERIESLIASHTCRCQQRETHA
jgi:hypothetical protein